MCMSIGYGGVCVRDLFNFIMSYVLNEGTNLFQINRYDVGLIRGLELSGGDRSS